MDKFTLMRAKRLLEKAIAGINTALEAKKNGDSVMFGEGVYDAENCSRQVSEALLAWFKKAEKALLRNGRSSSTK